MAWLYLPSMEYLSSLELEALTLGLNISSPIQEPFVMSRGKPMRLKSFMLKCSKENYLMPPYIPTCDPSHPLLITSLKKWISSLPVSLVSPSQTPVPEREPKITGGFGIQSFKPLGKFDLPSYSWKTFQTSLMTGGHLMKYQSPFPKSGSILNGVLFERPILAQIIKETVCSSLHTYPLDYTESKLNYQIQTSILPTPTANDGKNHTLPKSQSKRDSLVGKIMNLHGGEGTRLSPLFVEWMMGFPTGWTDLER